MFRCCWFYFTQNVSKNKTLKEMQKTAYLNWYVFEASKGCILVFFCQLSRIKTIEEMQSRHIKLVCVWSVKRLYCFFQLSYRQLAMIIITNLGISFRYVSVIPIYLMILSLKDCLLVICDKFLKSFLNHKHKVNRNDIR